MFVESVDIKEFRGILRCSSPLPLSKFTVLLGRNNSGKSSVLEALSLFPSYNDSKLYLGDSMLGALSHLHGGFTSLIYGYSGNAELTCDIDGSILTLDISDTNRATLRVSDPIIEIQMNEERLLLEEKLKRARTNAPLEIRNIKAQIKSVSSPSLKERVLRKIATSTEKHIDSDRYHEELVNSTFFIPNDTSFMDNLQKKIDEEPIWNLVTKSGANTKVIKLINKCVDDKYTEILKTPALSARKERGKERHPLYVKVKDLGDGIQKVVTTVLWLETLSPRLLLWDDFEGSAHPSLIKELLDWIAKKPWQVVMSTHSFDVLNSLLEVGPKDTTVIQLKKTDEDVLIQKSLSLVELEDIIDTSQDPRKLVDLLEL